MLDNLISKHFIIFWLLPIVTYFFLGEDYIINNTDELTEKFVENNFVKDISKKLLIGEKHFVICLMIFYSTIIIITFGFVDGINTIVLFFTVYSKLKNDETQNDEDLKKIFKYIFILLLICFFENITNINYYFEEFFIIKLITLMLFYRNNFSLTDELFIFIYNKLNPTNPFVELNEENNNKDNENDVDDL